jgi:hypothetical protein
MLYARIILVVSALLAFLFAALAWNRLIVLVPPIVLVILGVVLLFVAYIARNNK